jgi:cob(I)alamin adenosyltransferase
VGPEMQQYVNRLSDYLFVLAKIINFNSGVQEIIWKTLANKK